MKLEIAYGSSPGTLEHHRYFTVDNDKMFVTGGYIEGFGASDLMWMFYVNIKEFEQHGKLP